MPRHGTNATWSPRRFEDNGPGVRLPPNWRATVKRAVDARARRNLYSRRRLERELAALAQPARGGRE